MTNPFETSANTISLPAGLDEAEVKDKLKWHWPPGDYKARFMSVENKNSGAGNPQLVLTYEVDVEPGRSVEMYLYCPLTPGALWKLRSALEAMGAPLTGEIDVDKHKNAPVVATLEDWHKNNGTLGSSISRVVADAEAKSDDVPF